VKEQEVLALARQQDIDPATILHEEREVRLLAGIAADPVLALHLAFKGGTALRLIYLCDRYSDDLDFDLVRRDATPRQVLKRLRAAAVGQRWEVTDAWVKRRTVLLEVRAPGWRRRLKVEVSLLAQRGRVPTAVRNVVTPVFPTSVTVLTYPLPVLLSGKMLAVLERRYRTPRDLYDLFWLLSRGVEEDAAYLHRAATAAATKALTRSRPALYRALLARVDGYADDQIRTELGALLPRAQRRWAGVELKERTRELFQLRLRAMESR
jgi:predicted nucleotidyltransferase component of viral defense system